MSWRERERERRNGGYMQRDSHPIFVCHQDLEGQEMLLHAKMIVANCWFATRDLESQQTLLHRIWENQPV
jgi:hypothetical protein